ncbi:MAG: hypothetical protein PHH85_03535 [Candidatus Methanoperedens sp.]|nr:hypothetical protein [Candidatus Methanoperedens sp.]
MSKTVTRGTTVGSIEQINNALPAGANVIGKTGVDYSGSFYHKVDTAAADAARRMETASLKLRDCIIECETNDQLLGDAAAQGSVMAAGTSRGYSSIDLSTLYFKNKTAGLNGTIRVTGVRE